MLNTALYKLDYHYYSIVVVFLIFITSLSNRRSPKKQCHIRTRFTEDGADTDSPAGRPATTSVVSGTPTRASILQSTTVFDTSQHSIANAVTTRWRSAAI